MNSIEHPENTKILYVKILFPLYSQDVGHQWTQDTTCYPLQLSGHYSFHLVQKHFVAL